MSTRELFNEPWSLDEGDTGEPLLAAVADRDKSEEPKPAPARADDDRLTRYADAMTGTSLDAEGNRRLPSVRERAERAMAVADAELAEHGRAVRETMRQVYGEEIAATRLRFNGYLDEAAARAEAAERALAVERANTFAEVSNAMNLVAGIWERDGSDACRVRITREYANAYRLYAEGLGEPTGSAKFRASLARPEPEATEP